MYGGGGTTTSYRCKVCGATVTHSNDKLDAPHFWDVCPAEWRIPDGVTKIGDAVFQYCSKLTSITIPGNVTNIGQVAFSGCSGLTNVGIGNSVTSIGQAAFSGCSALTSVTIPNSLTNIDAAAFYNCTNLTGIYFRGNAPSVADSAFSGANALMYYLPGTTGWSTTLAGHSTLPWNPQIETSDGRFGVQTSQFGFNITGSYGLTVVVEVCTNLPNPIWYPLQSIALSGGSSYFSDSQWTKYPSRFYRIRSP